MNKNKKGAGSREPPFGSLDNEKPCHPNMNIVRIQKSVQKWTIPKLNNARWHIIYSKSPPKKKIQIEALTQISKIKHKINSLLASCLMENGD